MKTLYGKSEFEPFLHEQHDLQYYLYGESWRRFFRDPGCKFFVTGLYFTTLGRVLCGMSSAQRSELLPKVAESAVKAMDPANAQAMLDCAEVGGES